MAGQSPQRQPRFPAPTFSLWMLNPKTKPGLIYISGCRNRPSTERPSLEMHKSHTINPVVCLGFSLRVILCVYIREVVQFPLGSRWSNSPFLPLEVSWRRCLSSNHHLLKRASEAISASSVLFSPSWAIANMLSIKLHRDIGPVCL